jgi:hypothetical protein
VVTTVNKDSSSCEISSGTARGTPSKREGRFFSSSQRTHYLARMYSCGGPLSVITNLDYILLLLIKLKVYIKRVIIFIDVTRSIRLTVFMTTIKTD